MKLITRLESIEERIFFSSYRLTGLKEEAKELLAITVASIKTAKRNLGIK